MRDAAAHAPAAKAETSPYGTIILRAWSVIARTAFHDQAAKGLVSETIWADWKERNWQCDFRSCVSPHRASQRIYRAEA
jgi:hypothetical protein